MKVLPLPSKRPWRYAESKSGRFYIYASGQDSPLFTYHVTGLNAVAKRQLTANLIHIVECVNFTHDNDLSGHVEVSE